MDNCYINLGAVKTKEIDGELYISCWNFSKALSEKEREISDLCKENDELKKRISELESKIAEKEEALPFSSDEYEEVFLEELRSRDLNFNLVSKMLDVVELMLTDTQS